MCKIKGIETMSGEILTKKESKQARTFATAQRVRNILLRLANSLQINLTHF